MHDNNPNKRSIVWCWLSATMSRSRKGYGNFSSVSRMLTLTVKRYAQESGSLREDEINIIPSKSARAEQSQNTPISRSKLLDSSNEIDQNCVD